MNIERSHRQHGTHGVNARTSVGFSEARKHRSENCFFFLERFAEMLRWRNGNARVDGVSAVSYTHLTLPTILRV